LTYLKQIIRFYRDCYQFDLKGIRIKNFISNQCEKRLVPSNTIFFNEDNSRIPVDTDWAKEVEQILFLNSKEKILYAGSVFIKGKQNTLGSNRIAYVPLYIHELNLYGENGNYYISVLDTYLNPDFVELANGMDDDLNMSLDAVSNNAPPNPFGSENLDLLETFFNKYFASWNAYDIKNYSDTNFNFKNYFSRSKRIEINYLKFLSCMMIGVFKKPEGSMGILNELTFLSENLEQSSILNLFFKLKDFEINDIKRREIYLPATLSSKQESAFYTSDAYPISQIIGPPGTGKSFTIASIAIDAISNNKSVLIVTRNTQASKVITNIIENDFKLKRIVIKAYNQVYKRSLSSKLAKAISVNLARNSDLEKLVKRINTILNKIQHVENDIIEVEHDEIKWGAFYSEYQEKFFSRFKDKWFQYQKRNTKPIGVLNESLKELRNEKTRLIKKYIALKIKHDLYYLVKKKKTEFIKLNASLKERNITLVDKKLKKVDFSLVLNALPLWATTTKEISKCLPLEEGLFDLVIFDEASQCDIASSIPVLYRSKKAIIVGDPHQLQHISFLSDNKQTELRLKHSITHPIPDYRKESLIDWINNSLSNPDQTTFLDEHFRNRSSVGVNLVEVQHIIEKLKEITKNYKRFDKDLIPSIGIISPFTQQVQLLKKSVSKSIAFDLTKKHKILIGTPFHFQGEERDIILISFCIDANTHFAAINYLNRKDVFNVLITRARNKQILYTSLAPSSLPGNSLLKQYLESNSFQITKAHTASVYDLFVKHVSDFLNESGLEIVYQSIIVSGVQIDLVVVNDNKYYCIDVIGYPGDYEEQFNLEQLRILNRMDTPIFFLTYSSWYLEKEKVKKDLIKFIQN